MRSHPHRRPTQRVRRAAAGAAAAPLSRASFPLRLLAHLPPTQVVAADTGRSDNLSQDLRGGACSRLRFELTPHAPSHARSRDTSVIVTGPSLVVRGLLPSIEECPRASRRPFAYSFVHAVVPPLPSLVQTRPAPLLQCIGRR